jgi:hypothetical protein
MFLVCSSSSRKVLGLTPTAVFALATPKSPIDRGGRWQLQFLLILQFFFYFSVILSDTNIVPTLTLARAPSRSFLLWLPAICNHQQFVMPCALQATPEALIYERAMCDRVPLDELPRLGGDSGRTATMASDSGRLVLLGDAAHAVHPSMGQVRASWAVVAACWLRAGPLHRLRH